MDDTILIFWFLVVAGGSGLIVSLRRVRSAGWGWLVVYLAVLALAVSGYLATRPALLYAALGLWFLLVLGPGLLSKFYFQSFLQQRYAVAARFARVISWLHPADGWPQQVRLIRALELARQGDLDSAIQTLQHFKGGKSVISVAAVVHLYRVTHQWEELLRWHQQHLDQVEHHPQLLSAVLRAYGETGDVTGLLELYHRNKHRIAKLAPAASRDFCRLVLFAFCGKREYAERLFAGSLSVIPRTIQVFWLATAELAAGASDSAADQLRALLPEADAILRQAIERRLSQVQVPPPVLDASTTLLLDEAAREQAHDDTFGVQRSLFSRKAVATQLLIALNLAMFGVEILFGGSTHLQTLYRLGALYPPAVRGGEWWRLVASLFLHLGSLHLAMNMLGLWVLGPFVEFALGFKRFLMAYLLAGIGSMAIVMLFGSGPRSEQMTVGASGSIMALVGATGALMLRGWLREKAPSARRRLVLMLIIAGTQVMFDSVMPMVSTTGHLSGVLLGFVLTLLLRDRLIPSGTRQL